MLQYVVGNFEKREIMQHIHDMRPVNNYCKTANYNVQDIIANLATQAPRYFILLAII